MKKCVLIIQLEVHKGPDRYSSIAQYSDNAKCIYTHTWYM